MGGGVPPPPLAGVMADSGQRGCRFCLWAQTPHRVLLRSLPAGPGGPLGPPPSKHAPSLHGHCVLPVPRVTRLHLRFPHHGAGITPFPVSPSSRPRRAVCRRRAWRARHPRASAWSPQRPARPRASGEARFAGRVRCQVSPPGRPSPSPSLSSCPVSRGGPGSGRGRVCPAPRAHRAAAWPPPVPGARGSRRWPSAASRLRGASRHPRRPPPRARRPLAGGQVHLLDWVPFGVSPS